MIVIVKWDAQHFSTLVSDPFTDPANAGSQFASPSTRTKKDLSRINSLENGILLCLEHRNDYDNFRFSIHPEVKTLFLHHTISNFLLSRPTKYLLFIQSLPRSKVKAPWDNPDVFYPPPLPPFLGMHYITAIANAMKAGGVDHEMEFGNEDDEDFSEPEEIQIEETQNEVVRIWRDSLSPDTFSYFK